MKAREQLRRLESLILDPLQDVEGESWHRAPKGKWSLAQILTHLSIGADLVATTLEHRVGKLGMKRRATRREAVFRHLLLGVGKFPPGSEAPERTVPEDRPDPELITAQFRMALERLEVMLEQWPEDRQLNVFVRHPVLGDLNLPEWIRFQYVHGRHHAGQIQERLRWLGHSPG